MKIARIISKVLNCFLLFLLSFIVIFNLLGFKLMYVVSESMEPTFYKGDLIISKTLDNNFTVLTEGEVIIFNAPWFNNEIVTHRIIEINDDEIITQGDNNDVSDPVGSINNVVGVVVQSVDNVGYIFSPLSLKLLILSASSLLFIIAAIDYKKAVQEEKKFKKQQNQTIENSKN